MPEDGRELETFATAILNAHRVIAKVFPNLSDLAPSGVPDLS